MKPLRFKKFDRQTKMIIASTTFIGSSIGVGCSYIYAVIETLVSSK